MTAALLSILAGLAFVAISVIVVSSSRLFPRRRSRERQRTGRDRGSAKAPRATSPPALEAVPVQPERRSGGGGDPTTERIPVTVSPLAIEDAPVATLPRVHENTVAEADAFVSRTVGVSSKHAHHPWRLPPRPSQSGVAADQAEVGDLVVRAASVVGISHRLARPAQARQDSYRLGMDGSGDHLVIAVSDGVGAAPQSELGATIACRAAVDAIRGMLDNATPVDGLDVHRVFDDAARFMAGAADQQGMPRGDMAAVMVVAVVPVRAGERGGRRAWLAWLGDASVWARSESRWQRLAGDGKEGLDRNHVGAALPHGHRQALSTVVDLPPACVFTVVTDGIGDALGRAESAAWFANRWQRPPALASFLMDVDFDARQTTDDRTAVTVWCTAAGRHAR